VMLNCQIHHLLSWEFQFEAGGKLSQFDWPFETEAMRSCQKDVNN